MSLFRMSRRVDFCDTDLAGIVHFANFFRYMEAAEVEYLRSKGLSVMMEWQGQRLAFPRVSVSCDYQKPAHFDELLDIAVTPVRLGAKSVTYAFAFSVDAEVIAKGKMTSVCCRVAGDEGLESIEIPPEIRAILEQDMLSNADPQEVLKKLLQEALREAEQTPSGENA